MAKAKWKLPTFTREMIEADLKKLGAPPPHILKLFANRNDDAEACRLACVAHLETDPENNVVRIYLAELAQTRNDHLEVLFYARPVTESLPTMYPAWKLRGIAELNLHDGEAATRSLMTYCTINRTDSQGLCFLALAYAQRGVPKAGILLVDEMLQEERFANSTDLLLIRAMLKEKVGETDAALLDYAAVQIASDELKDFSARKMHSLMFMRDSKDEAASEEPEEVPEETEDGEDGDEDEEDEDRGRD